MDITSRHLVAMTIDPFSAAIISALAGSFGKVLGEAGLKLFGMGGRSLYDGAGNLTQEAFEILQPIARKYIENYTKRHGTFNVLGMGKPVSIESVYTQVNFNRDIISTYDSVDKQEIYFREREHRSQPEYRQEGMTVANKHQYLMVLGGPGMGKTTFLRKVGLEALKQAQGEYHPVAEPTSASPPQQQNAIARLVNHRQNNSLFAPNSVCVPVFLELRQLRWDKLEQFDLEAKIAEEFQNCGLPNADKATQNFLEKGRLLILFDGLDEVPTEQLGKMTIAIRNLVDRYDQNRFVTSCRIAAYRNFDNFRRFTNVVISDFDDRQIECFITNWFKSHDRQDWGHECWMRLSNDDQKATKELARTPLLLTLICILFLKQGELPTKRATLYDRAVSTLLSEWDATKEIVRQQPYKGLDLKCKEEMLSEIAYRNFIENNLFFQQGEIAKQIETVLLEMLKDEQRINGKDVLRAIEEQHGILVNQDRDLYSFSHLTLQEFLTAKYIIDNNVDLNEIVVKYVCVRRWREIFLLLAGLRKADDLLLAIEKRLRTYMATPKLQNILIWVGKVTDSTDGDIQHFGKRALATANAYFNAYFNAYANANAKVEAYSNANANAYFNAYANTRSILIYVYSNANANANPYSNANAIDQFIEHAQWSLEFDIYQEIDLLGAIRGLKKLKIHIPDNKQPREAHREFARKLIKTWLKVFRMTPEMVDLSKAEIQNLDDYFYADLLLIECERAAVRRSPAVWSAIKSRMLRI